MEIHEGIWDENVIRRALTFMHDNGMNTLVLHRADIVDRIVFPLKYFGHDGPLDSIHHAFAKVYRMLYKYTPSRRGEPLNLRDFVKRVLVLAERAGISVYLENKEIWFADAMLEFHPELFKAGVVCPSEAFWDDFLRTKYEELFADLPGLAGIITSLGTAETRAFVAGNRCTCDKCAALIPDQWYYQKLMAMFDPIARAGRKLVVRDFVFDAETHGHIATVMARLPREISVSLKNTPHDFYPTFPDNQRIGKTEHAEWIEYDVMGQDFGWGVMPCDMIQDLRERMTYAAKMGAVGALIRVDWEWLPDHSVFDTPNLVNLYGAAALARDLTTSDESIYAKWLHARDMLAQPNAPSHAGDAAKRMAEIGALTWGVVRQSMYINRFVFNDNSMLPVSLEHAFWLADVKNSLRDWDPSAEGGLEMTVDNTVALLHEKKAAWNQFLAFEDEIKSGNPGLSDSAYADLLERLSPFKLCVRGFVLLGTASILAWHLAPLPSEATDTTMSEATGDAAIEDGMKSRSTSQPWPLAQSPEAMLIETAEKIHRYLDDVTQFYAGTDHAYIVYLILNPERIDAFLNDVRATIAALGLASKESESLDSAGAIGQHIKSDLNGHEPS